MITKCFSSGVCMPYSNVSSIELDWAGTFWDTIAKTGWGIVSEDLSRSC